MSLYRIENITNTQIEFQVVIGGDLTTIVLGPGGYTDIKDYEHTPASRILERRKTIKISITTDVPNIPELVISPEEQSPDPVVTIDNKAEEPIKAEAIQTPAQDISIEPPIEDKPKKKYNKSKRMSDKKAELQRIKELTKKLKERNKSE